MRLTEPLGGADKFRGPDKMPGQEQGQEAASKFDSLKAFFTKLGFECKQSAIDTLKDKLKAKFIDTAGHYGADVKKTSEGWSITVKNKENHHTLEWTGFDPERAFIDLTRFFTEQAASLVMHVKKARSKRVKDEKPEEAVS